MTSRDSLGTTRKKALEILSEEMIESKEDFTKSDAIECLSNNGFEPDLAEHAVDVLLEKGYL